MTFETVAEFVKRGGTITVAKPRRAKNAQKKQTIKVPFRIGKLVR
jgi:hypothetical protein